jgi:hypothetical protein
MNSPYWFELAVVFGLVCIGNIVFAPFAEGLPKWRRVAKMFLGGAIAVAISATAGREWFFVLLGAMSVLFVFVHGWLLPKKHGINGWTAEPKEKYYALRGWKMNR